MRKLLRFLLLLLLIIPACTYIDVPEINPTPEPWNAMWERTSGMESRPDDNLMLLTKERILWHRVVEEDIDYIIPQRGLEWGEIHLKQGSIPYFMYGEESLYMVVCGSCLTQDTVKFQRDRG